MSNNIFQPTMANQMGRRNYNNLLIIISACFLENFLNIRNRRADNWHLQHVPEARRPLANILQMQNYHVHRVALLWKTFNVEFCKKPTNTGSDLLNETRKVGFSHFTSKLCLAWKAFHLTFDNTFLFQVRVSTYRFVRWRLVTCAPWCPWSVTILFCWSISLFRVFCHVSWTSTYL